MRMLGKLAQRTAFPLSRLAAAALAATLLVGGTALGENRPDSGGGGPSAAGGMRAPGGPARVAPTTGTAPAAVQPGSPVPGAQLPPRLAADLANYSEVKVSTRAGDGSTSIVYGNYRNPGNDLVMKPNGHAVLSRDGILEYWRTPDQIVQVDLKNGLFGAGALGALDEMRRRRAGDEGGGGARSAASPPSLPRLPGESSPAPSGSGLLKEFPELPRLPSSSVPRFDWPGELPPTPPKPPRAGVGCKGCHA